MTDLKFQITSAVKGLILFTCILRNLILVSFSDYGLVSEIGLPGIAHTAGSDQDSTIRIIRIL